MAVVLAAGNAACGSADGTTGEPAMGGSAATAGTGNPGSAGNGGNAGGGGGAVTGGSTSGGGAGQPPNSSAGHGYLVLAHAVDTAARVELRASFGTGPAGTCPPVGTFGDCVLALCPTNDPGAIRDLSAGTVSAVSAAVAMQLAAQPDPTTGTGYSKAQQTLMGNFKGGETLTFAATGGDVPAFSQDLKMIAAPLLIQPMSATPKIPIARTGVDLQWQPGEAGTQVSVVAFGSASDWTSLTCTWDASKGAGSIPAEALKPLANGQELSIAGRREVTQNVGNFAVQLILLTSARTANDPRARQLVLTDPL